MVWEQSSYIYNLLRDDESRRVFANRIIYSATNDNIWINSLVDNVNGSSAEEKIKRLYAKKINKFIYEMRNEVIEIIENELKSRKVVVCPALGRDCINFLRLFKDTRNIVLCDRRGNGQIVYGKEVFSTEKAIKNYRDALWVVLSVNFSSEIRNELSNQGISSVYVDMKSYESIMQSFGQGYILSENTCRELMEKTYFDEGIMIPGEKEIFVDCGYYDGFSTKQFINWCNNDYERIIAFEPDEDNFHGIKQSKQVEKMDVYNVGCWSEKSVLSFAGGRGEASKVDENGDKIINVDSIDNILAGDKCTFIKMDIEGAELEALRGAEKTIKKWKPRLAISIYHKPEDIIDVPMYILSLCPEYKIYMRHYTYGRWDTVLYAII